MSGAPPFRALGIDHVVIRVRDLARMQRFYCEVLGCAVARVRPDLGLVHLRCGRALIDLVDVAGELGRRGGAPPAAEARNMDHLCIGIDPFDAEALRRHLEAHGIAPGEIERRFGAEGEGPSLYVADPEGNTVELKGPAAG